MPTNLCTTPLEGLALIAARGPDARKFLHGQVSQDVLGLAPDQVALAGFHNPQGRVVAILRLIPLDDDGLMLALPTELAAPVVQRLRRFVLLARVTLEDVSAAWLRVGLAGPGAAAALATAGLASPDPRVGALARRPGALAWRHAIGPERFVLLADTATGLPSGLPPASTEAAADWRAADVAAGLPEVHAATSEVFVAQMLNLDALGGISFTKGCYTGQEVIARAHYRGRVKRRLQRFRSLAPLHAPPRPGDAITLEDGRAARWVECAPLADGRIEFLAVAPLAAGDPGDEVAAATPDGAPMVEKPAAASPGGASAAAAPIAAERLPLPYPLPD